MLNRHFFLVFKRALVKPYFHDDNVRYEYIVDVSYKLLKNTDLIYPNCESVYRYEK